MSPDISPQPDYVPVGHSVRLVSLPELARVFKIQERYALDLLNTLQIPVLTVASDRNPDGSVLDGKIYVNLFALETALFTATMPAWSPDAKSRPGLAAWYQSMAALENATLDKASMETRLKGWIDRLKARDRRKLRAGKVATIGVP